MKIRKADIMFEIEGEKTIELDGFMLDENNALISDSCQIGDLRKVKIHLEPSMLKFLIEENEQKIEDICDIVIM